MCDDLPFLRVFWEPEVAHSSCSCPPTPGPQQYMIFSSLQAPAKAAPTYFPILGKQGKPGVRLVVPAQMVEQNSIKLQIRMVTKMVMVIKMVKWHPK